MDSYVKYIRAILMTQLENIYISIQYEHCLPANTARRKEINVNFTINQRKNVSVFPENELSRKHNGPIMVGFHIKSPYFNIFLLKVL